MVVYGELDSQIGTIFTVISHALQLETKNIQQDFDFGPENASKARRYEVGAIRCPSIQFTRMQVLRFGKIQVEVIVL